MNEFLIKCQQPIVSFDYWNEIYQQARNNKNFKAFGYGIRVDTKEYAELEKIRNDLPFKDHFFFLISNKKKREFPIHVDGIPGNKNAASVNWPLQNCNETSPTTWYHCDTMVYNNIDKSYFLKNVEDAVEIHSDTMYSKFQLPYLFRSDILHRGYCNMQTSGFRIILKWELEFDDWKTACTEFHNRNYI